MAGMWLDYNVRIGGPAVNVRHDDDPTRGVRLSVHSGGDVVTFYVPDLPSLLDLEARVRSAVEDYQHTLDGERVALK